MDVGASLAEVAVGIGAGLLGKWLWDRAGASDRAAEAAKKSDERIREELQHYGRRVEDRFVLRDVCERCQRDQGHQATAVREQLADLKEEMRRNFAVVFNELRSLAHRNGTRPTDDGGG